MEMATTSWGLGYGPEPSSPYKDKELAKWDTALEYWICDGGAVFLDWVSYY
jgi:hypothetical protein